MSQIVLQSTYPSKCLKDVPKEEISVNAQWLTRGGFVNRLMAGAYSYLPLGMRVLRKIENIVREEMNALDSAEILMPALHPKSVWDTTGRWDKMSDIMYQVKGGEDKIFGLGPTHEEVVTPLMGGFVQSYKDLPFSAYQIQTKYRNEARPKSGMLRGREFRMKDMYSFHLDQDCLDTFYDRSIEAYKKVFTRCGIGDRTYVTFASGGAFSKYSHEFQAVTEYGEDEIYLDRAKNIAVNKEIIDDDSAKEIIDIAGAEKVKAIEVGNIFKLGSRFADDFGVYAVDADGQRRNVVMGCYGIGTSRIMGAIVELCHDENGIIWPEGVAPFDVHMIVIGKDDAALEQAKATARELAQSGIDVLIDDRAISPGQKFTESDIIGIPTRMIFSPKLQGKSLAEVKCRKTGEVQEYALSDLVGMYCEKKKVA